MMRGFCPRGFCPEGAYVLMELCMEGVLSKGVLSERFLSGGGFCPTFHIHSAAHKGNPNVGRDILFHGLEMGCLTRLMGVI